MEIILLDTKVHGILAHNLINQASKELVQKNMNKTKCDIRKEPDINNKNPGNTRRSH